MSLIANIFGCPSNACLQPLNQENITPVDDPFDNTDGILPFFNDISNIHSESTSFIGDINSNVVVRISGTDFSTFSQYIKSHEQLIHNCFIEVTNKLITKFEAQCGFTIGDNILLFFSATDSGDEPIYQNTQITCSEMVSYATIMFDKCLNKIINDIANEYTIEIASIMLEDDLIFRGIPMVCSDEEIIKYIDYIIYRSTDYLEEEYEFYGTIVKPSLKIDVPLRYQTEDCCTYKHITLEDAQQSGGMFTIDFLMKPYCLLEKYQHK